MMRGLGLGLIISAILLAGCAPRPRVDLNLLDHVPVVPLQMATGCGTGLLLPSGEVLTCSHILPRGLEQGDVRITGPWIRYHANRSGDNLRERWTTWEDGRPSNATNDWALIVPDPPVKADDIFFPPAKVDLVTDLPRVGETVYIVGYTVQGTGQGRFVRYWTPMLVVRPPRSRYAAFGPQLIWLRSGSYDQTAADAEAGALINNSGEGRLGPIRKGFSGAPVLRHLGGGRFEVCALFVDAEFKGESATGIGIAIPLPPADELGAGAEVSKTPGGS
jgi:hypothetical protein